MPTIVVIDNERDEVLRLCTLLTAAFPGWTILPDKRRREREEPFADWEGISSYLLAIDDTEVVLCLDLSVEKRTQDWEDIDRGVRHAHSFRANRPDWTFVAYTRNAAYARRKSGFAETFDDTLDKSELAEKSSHESAAAFVRSVVERARRHRRVPGAEAIPPNVHVKDSLGMRSFRAAFSDEAIGELVRAEAANWESVQIKSLTSGYSGAFMLKLTSEAAGRSLILKVARHEETISHEINAVKEHLAELAPFAARLATIEPNLHRLKDGVYYLQMPIQGPTLLRYCLDKHYDDTLLARQNVASLCLRVLRATPLAKRPINPARSRFGLSPIDIGRFETSAEFLIEFGSALAATKLWPSALPSVAEMAAK